MKLVLIAVVRYFGGTKLGIGPLSKAYLESAKLVLGLTEIERKFITTKYKLTLAYDEYENIKSFLTQITAETTNIEYREKIALQVSVRLSRKLEFEEFFKNYFKGKIVFEKVE